MKYKVRGTDLSFLPEIEVEADNEDDVKAIYHTKWENGELQANDSDIEIVVEPPQAKSDCVVDKRRIGHKSEEWCGECGHVFNTEYVFNTCPECGSSVWACDACINHEMCGICHDASCFRSCKSHLINQGKKSS